jgi:hypothetical protein
LDFDLSFKQRSLPSVKTTLCSCNCWIHCQSTKRR